MESEATVLFPAIPEQVLHDLRKLNIPMYLSGYQCLCVAIPRFAQDISQPMCSELYPEVAKALGYTDWRAVEFAIRRVIMSAWKSRNAHIWSEYFPGIAKVPTNKQFIATLAQRIKYHPPGEGRAVYGLSEENVWLFVFFKPYNE